ncbi:Helitron helicase-like protein [Phytophthora palmivora]|uniref:Helitron helicase-like protein n=1 Tax=Phytophthora palmivora TaxID=4796 RepID=A0A2P4YSZ2_9STRA|nr:Helitron helicase-like protein [Phytophthora palmivora]
MTCNPNWPEIKENLRPGEKASDRPDIVARVFMQKLKTLNKDLDEGLLGIVAARIHVVEYQKRILSHKGKVWDNAKINQWDVPYNPFLSQKYDCHINVEVCATNKAVKYIYKYVYKGSDMTTITIEGEEIQANEILQYLLGRYISPVEACMRLFGFPTQGSSHAVVNLPIHLEV